MTGYITNFDEAPDISGIYYLYQSFILVYIGKTDDSIKNRIKSHLKNKDFNQIRFKFVPKGITRQVEKKEIEKFIKSKGQLPYYNRIR